MLHACLSVYVYLFTYMCLASALRNSDLIFLFALIDFLVKRMGFSMLSGPLINVLFSVNFNEGHSIWINCWRICIFRKEYWFFILNGYQLTAHKPHYDQLISFAFSIQTKPSNLYGNSIPATAHIIRLCVSTTCFLIVASEIDHNASYIRTKIRPYDCTKRVCVCVYACSVRAADTTFTNTKSFVSVALDVSLLPAFGAFAHIRPHVSRLLKSQRKLL